MNWALLVALALSHLPGGTTRVLTQGSTHTRSVALTFDAGADRGFAAQILQTLERNGVHASFGMTGQWAVSNPDLVRRMRRDGDQLMNHTYDHRSFTGLSTRSRPLTDREREWEIAQTDRVLFRLTRKSSKPFFRPPFGEYDRATLALLHRLGYNVLVMWTLDSLGWERLPANVILERCWSRTVPGTIYLMHVGSQSQDASALQPLITRLKRAKYGFVTVSQISRNGR